MILSSAALLGLAAIIQKNVLTKEHSLSFVVGLWGFASIILLPNFLNMNFSSFTPGLIALTILRSVFVALGHLFFTRGLRHNDISVAVPISNLSSVFVLILGILVLGEQVTLLQIFGVFLMILGTYTLELHKDHSFFEPLRLFKSKYIHYIMFSLICFSFSAITTKTVFTRYDVAPFDYLHVSFMCGFIFLLIYYRFTKQSYRTILREMKHVGLLISIIALLEIASTYLYFMVVKMPAAAISLIIPLRRLGTLIDVIVGGKVFHEDNLFIKAISTIVILAGVFCIVFSISE